MWEPTTEDFTAPKMVGHHPSGRALRDCRAAFVVHCWGRSYQEAWQMRQALATALNDALDAYWSFGQSRVQNPDNDTAGWAIEQQVTFSVPLLEAHIPTEATTDPTPIGEPTTVQPEYVGFVTITPVNGDGSLVAPNQ